LVFGNTLDASGGQANGGNGGNMLVL